jgi:hypothetical protein
VLNRFDDYLIHQAPAPIDQVSTSDRNFYDRYWFNGYSREADLYFGVALGLYPNRRVMDASFSVVRGGVQVSVHASRLAPRERSETRVEPISVEVIEPLSAMRVRVEPNQHGIEADLLFRPRTRVLEEPRLTRRLMGHLFMDSTRFAQCGNWEGSLAVAGESLAIDPSRILGTRDRSWGIRPVGERELGAPGPLPQFFFLWSPLQFDDLCTHFQVNEDETGRAWHSNGAIVPLLKAEAGSGGEAGEPAEVMASVSHEIRWEKGTRRSAGARLTLTPRRGEPHVITLEPVLRFQMRGLGYLDPEWGHGVWKGEHAVGGDSWVLDEVDPMDPRYVHVQQLCRARFGEREGLGILEKLVIGPHEPSGFGALLDPAT